jgi:hypothetical protein
MRFVANWVNLVFVIIVTIWLGYEIQHERGPISFRTSEWIIIVVLYALPAVNFLALSASGKGKDFLALYFERKRLEQENRIAELRKSLGEKERS